SSWKSLLAISCCGRAVITRPAPLPIVWKPRCVRRRRWALIQTKKTRKSGEAPARQPPARQAGWKDRWQGGRQPVVRPEDEAIRPAVQRPHRVVRVRQVAGDSSARGSRLLLRRQPADDADPDARQAVTARRR